MYWELNWSSDPVQLCHTVSLIEIPDMLLLAESRPSNKTRGQRPENPLLLLGQYSDEEVEEDSGKKLNHDTGEKSPAELDEQAKVDNHDGMGTDEDENITAGKVDQENKDLSSSLDVPQNSEVNGAIEENKTESPHVDTNAVEQASVHWTSDTQTSGDADSGWKMVLHEESNSYYYWNIVTGETSWEVPVVLTQGNGSAYDPKSAPEVVETHVTSVDTQPTNGSPDGMVFEAMKKSELEVHNDGSTNILANYKGECNHVNTTDGGNMLSSSGEFARHFNDTLSNGVAYHDDTSIQDMSGHVYQGTVGDPSSDSSRLLQLGENLLERLKLLKGSEGFSDQISKLTFELDIRLADIKSLVPYGSSLLPFWLHSENQLKRLEAAVNNEVLKCSQCANIGEINEPVNKLQEDICKPTANENNSTYDSAEFETSYHNPNASVEANESTLPADINANVGHHSVEDEDMDVEMEVEEGEIPVVDESGNHHEPQSDQSIHEARGSEEEFAVPPPPNDEWVPPPPPDDEPFPPPPPDEPPEAMVPPPLPPSEMQTAQPYFGEQYSFTYPGSTYEYYGQTNTEVASSNYYVDANGCQVAAPLPTLYYGTVVNPYSDGNSVMNPGQPVAYYTLQNGSVPTAPVVGSVETQSSTDAPVTSTVTRDVSLVSAPAVATKVPPTEPVTKVQPKVSRNKKRTVASVPSLRSNKKVSGLVDKWKAVKEEMHEDEEDEPENALELLEKKRQREIEQWHAQQIATGEAKDNANFQPLGGDWRERVRRKRAKKSKEAEENLAKATDDTNQQPDLVELSKQLPSGWQAYWDEASKQVYYGNSTTSKTTWVKPTK